MLSKALNQAYALLDPEVGGIMFIQIPRKIYDTEGARKDFYTASEIDSLKDTGFYRRLLG